jgi:hypothetical protein
MWLKTSFFMYVPDFDSAATVTWNELIAITNIEKDCNAGVVLKSVCKLLEVAIRPIVLLLSNLIPTSLLHYSLF